MYQFFNDSRSGCRSTQSLFLRILIKLLIPGCLHSRKQSIFAVLFRWGSEMLRFISSHIVKDLSGSQIRKPVCLYIFRIFHSQPIYVLETLFIKLPSHLLYNFLFCGKQLVLAFHGDIGFCENMILFCCFHHTDTDEEQYLLFPIL